MIKTKEKDIKSLIKKLAITFLVVSATLNLAHLALALPQYLSFFEGLPLMKRFAADFFFFIAFAQKAFTSSDPYTSSLPIAQQYFNVDFELFKLPYPPNIITLIGPYFLIHKIFGIKATIISVFLINFSFSLSIAIILNKISKFKIDTLLLVFFASNFSAVVITSGQLSFIFASFLSGAVLFYLKDQKLLSGILLSIFILKPQLAILIGLLSLWDRRVFLGTLIGTSATTIFTLILCKPAIYMSYFESFFEKSDKALLIFSERAVTFPSILFNNFGLNQETSLIVHIAVSIACILLIYFIFKKDKNLSIESKLGLVILVNFIICPYSLIYDLTISIVGIVLLAKQYHKDTKFLILCFLYLFASSSYFLSFIGLSSCLLFLSIVILYITIFKTSLFKISKQT